MLLSQQQTEAKKHQGGNGAAMQEANAQRVNARVFYFSAYMKHKLNSID